MIPKVIHYCWFGGNPLPELTMRCIESWKKYCPDYVIKEWNESNFKIDCCDYVKEAYEAKKWAFVSDYARFWILFHEGGLYFDTDVELIGNIDDLVSRGPFMGFEVDMADSVPGTVAPGLGLAAEKRNYLYGAILEYYNDIHFRNADGSLNQTTIVKHTTQILQHHGLTNREGIQCVKGIYIYPKEYFCPMDYFTGDTKITNNTRSIHHYQMSWKQKEEIMYHNIERKLGRLIGQKCASIITRIIDFPFRVKKKLVL